MNTKSSFLFTHGRGIGDKVSSLLLLLVLVLLTPFSKNRIITVSCIPYRRDWSKLNLDELDRQWNSQETSSFSSSSSSTDDDDDDDDDYDRKYTDITNNHKKYEDMTEDEEIYYESQKRREDAMKRFHELFDATSSNINSNSNIDTDENTFKPGNSEFEKLAKEVENTGKPAMIFAKLKKKSSVLVDDNDNNDLNNSFRNIVRLMERNGRRRKSNGSSDTRRNTKKGKRGNENYNYYFGGGDDHDSIVENNDKDGWNWDELSYICEEWQYRLSLNMITMICYPIVPDSILVTVQRGWYGDEVFGFLSTQKELIFELSWNERKVWPGGNGNSGGDGNGIDY